jgi:hypothetical protein
MDDAPIEIRHETAHDHLSPFMVRTSSSTAHPNRFSTKISIGTDVPYLRWLTCDWVRWTCSGAVLLDISSRHVAL